MCVRVATGWVVALVLPKSKDPLLVAVALTMGSESVKRLQLWLVACLSVCVFVRVCECLLFAHLCLCLCLCVRTCVSVFVFCLCVFPCPSFLYCDCRRCVQTSATLAS